MVAWTSLLFLDEHCRMPPHQDVELVAGSYGTQRDAELARGVCTSTHSRPMCQTGSLERDFDPPDGTRPARGNKTGFSGE